MSLPLLLNRGGIQKYLGRFRGFREDRRVIWGIQGSGGSVFNVIGVLERVICRRRVWDGGIKPPLQCRGVGARGWRSTIEIFEGQTVLVFIVRQYVVLTGPTPCPRPRSLTTQSRPNRTRGPSYFSQRIPGGRTGFPGHPSSFSFLCFPFAKSLRGVGWFCALMERTRMNDGTKIASTFAHLFDPLGLHFIWRVFIAIGILVALLRFYRAVYHASFALIC